MKKFVISVIADGLGDPQSTHLISAPLQSESVDAAVGAYLIELFLKNPGISIKSLKYVEV